MNKTAIIALFLIVTAVIAMAVIVDKNTGKTVDWTESFNERSNKPYGLSVLYKELPKLFDNNSIKPIYYTPSNYFYANSEDGYGDFIAEGTYILIGNSNTLEVEDIDELLIFAGRGNTLFMSDYNFPKTLLDTLNLTIKTIKNKDTIANLSFKNDLLKSKNTTIDKSENSSYFSIFPSENHKVL